MCGIAGIVDTKGRLGRERLAEIATAMRDTLTHRGPDDAGTWVDPSGTCALAHRRLSILDLSERGRQPMVTPDGQVGLSFNGEIYNYKALRADLESRGYTLQSDTDAEALLYLTASAHASNLDALDGMYSFAVWNASNRKLLLARDPFGKKPLYVAEGDDFIAFASELQALRMVPGFDDRISDEAVGEYLLLQYVHAPRTIYVGAEKVMPGAWLQFDFRDGEPIRHEGRHAGFEPDGGHAPGQPYRPVTDAELDPLVDELLPIVLRAVEKRLQSDVPLGAFLSGGIDSGVVAAMVTRELGQELKTFSIGFEGSDESEHLQAREAAGLLGTDHHEKMLAPDAIALLPTIAAALDEPLGDSSCLPTYLLSEFTREHVTVSLSGDGGDELFGGYGRYRETLREESDWKMRALWLVRQRRAWRAADAYNSLRWLMFMPEDVKSLAGDVPGNHAERLRSRMVASMGDLETPLIHRMRRIDAETYMPGAVLAKVDRMSMAFALEVRCPLLDRDVAAYAQGLAAEHCYADGLTKPLLRRLASRYLPTEYTARRKLGFGLPGQAWTQEDILGQADELLLAPGAKLAGTLGTEGLRRFVAHQRQEHCFSIFQTWTVLMLEAWLRQHEAPPTPSTTPRTSAVTGASGGASGGASVAPASTRGLA